MREVYGTNRSTRKVELPIEHKEYHNLSYRGIGEGKQVNRFKASIKTYDNNNKMPWMDTSIDISQPEIKRFLFDERSQERNINRSQLNNKISDIFNAQNSSREPEKNSYQYLETINQK